MSQQLLDAIARNLQVPAGQIAFLQNGFQCFFNGHVGGIAFYGCSKVDGTL